MAGNQAKTMAVYGQKIERCCIDMHLGGVGGGLPVLYKGQLMSVVNSDDGGSVIDRENQQQKYWQPLRQPIHSLRMAVWAISG